MLTSLICRIINTSALRVIPEERPFSPQWCVRAAVKFYTLHLHIVVNVQQQSRYSHLASVQRKQSGNNTQSGMLNVCVICLIQDIFSKQKMLKILVSSDAEEQIERDLGFMYCWLWQFFIYVKTLLSLQSLMFGVNFCCF